MQITGGPEWGRERVILRTSKSSSESVLHAANRAGGVEELAGWFDFCKTAPAAPALVMTSRFLRDGAFGGLKTSVVTTAKRFGEEEEAEDPGLKLKLL